MGLLPSRSACVRSVLGSDPSASIVTLGHVIVCLWSVPSSSQQDQLRCDRVSAASRNDFSAVE